ncbi:MAG TPA: hypothetical protein VN930_09730 [Xanthobacteraceae bacterium]|nr:hypothetical protein [Xanthobacteraceae bacterium]
MFKFKVTLLAATVAGGFALIGAASAGPLSTSPISAPTDVEQTEAQVQAQGRQNVEGRQNVQSRQNARRSTANRSRHVRRYRGYQEGYYAPDYGYGYGYGYGSPYAYRPAPGLWLGAPGFGFGIGL